MPLKRRAYLSVLRVALESDALGRELGPTCAHRKLARADRRAQVAVHLQRGVALGKGARTDRARIKCRNLKASKKFVNSDKVGAAPAEGRAASDEAADAIGGCATKALATVQS